MCASVSPYHQQEKLTFMTAIAPDHVENPLMERRYEEQIEPVNRLVDETRALRPATSVSYVDPVHNVEEVRIISLFSNIGAANESGFIDAGSQEASTRMLGMQWQLGLRPEFLLPWNVHPWHTPGEANAVVVVKEMQKRRPTLGMTLVEAAAPRSVDVGSAARSLIGKVDVIYTNTDNNVVSAYEALVKVGQDAKIPLIA